MTKISLWLVPSGEAYRTLSEIIGRLSRQYKTVSFEPHVTLVPDVEKSPQEVIRITSLLSRSLRPFMVHMTDAGCSDDFYMSLFLKVEQTKEVMNANALARKTFSKLEESYDPHLSLIYGNLDSREKEKILNNLGKIDISFEANQLWIVGDPADHWPKIKEFALR